MPCGKYIWGSYKYYDFEKHLSTDYEKIVFWKKNLFLLPPGKAGRRFLKEVSRLMNDWLQDSPLKDIAFKAIMPKLKKDGALERRVDLWESGELMELLK